MIRSFSEGGAVSNNSAPIPSGVTGSRRTFDAHHDGDVAWRSPWPSPSHRAGKEQTALPVFVDQHLHSLSGSALAGLGTFHLTDPAQVLVLVR